MDTIESIEVAAVQIPLDKPVQLGPLTIVQRDYVVVRVALSDGAEGFSYGYDRGLPLFDLTVKAAMSYIGQSSAERNRLRRTALGPLPAPHAAMTRGVSLCDVATWDSFCQSHGLPLWKIIGGSRRSVPAMPVIGYGMTAETAGEEGAFLADEGFKIIKCMIDGVNFRLDEALLTSLAEALPSDVRIGIDAHWSWTNATQALPWCRLAERLGACFIEDPFTPTNINAFTELAARVEIPLAVGEDVIDIYGFRDLAPSCGILRFDASVSGGISAMMDMSGLARAYARPIIPHVFPGLHSQLGFSNDNILCVEMFSRKVAADPIDRFLSKAIKVENGNIVATDDPGAGLSLQWGSLAQHRTRYEKLSI